ncbi:PREDICTED: protein HAPLESS 2-like [Acropora digitifera]|uniref:protein HAPLESS 2-like n=1 Tax=Acropora digitifera TaxID=70779 RepID=UPI00077AB325|nr:PREDICTED: protein HAPLESS 2-like [Acropora digitifera]
MSVVYEKACEKKLIVTMTVRSGQNGTELLKTVSNVSKVYDEVEREQARLYNPFIITLAKTPVHLTYPYYYRGTVNNRPQEKVVISDNAIHTSGSRNLCDDTWETGESTCGFDHDAQGNKIWDSQGFCCWCSEQDKWRGSFKDSTPFSRAGLSCKVFAKAQAAAHCMKYDDLWYTVNELGRWEMEFGVHVKTYDQVLEKKNNVTKAKWIPGGEIVIGPHVRLGRGKYGRLLASYIGEFQTHRQFPTLTEKFLLIPYVTDKIDPKTHPQVMEGPRNYLIVDKHEVNYKPTGPHQCDKIGVTYTAFRNQQPGGCHQKQGACLNNQPYDYFVQDKARRAQGIKPLYFPEKVGKLVGLKSRPTDGQKKEFMLTYEIDEVMTSMVTLQISADDIILIYNRASGKILKAYAQDFEALSKDGHLYVIVQNTGYVTADFSVVISTCSGAIGKFREKSISINPQKTHMFTFTIHAYNEKGGNNFCIVRLFDARQKMVDSANVTFTTTAPCVCATGCGCSCYEGGFECVDRDDRDWDEEKPTESGLDLGGAVDIWTKIKNVFNKIGDVIKFLKTPAGIGSLVGILIGLGALKAFMGLRKKGSALARFGLGGVKKGKQEKRDHRGQIIVVEYNEEGDEIDPESKEVTKPRNKKKEFILNLFFFLIIPFLLLFKLWKLIVRICCAKLLEKKEDTKKITEDDSPSANQGSEENVSKEEDIMKEEGSRLPDSNANSKENIVGGKRSHSTDSSSSNLAIKKSKHGSGDKIVTPDVKGTAKDSKSNEPPADLKPLLDTLVYHHFYDTDAVAGELEDPGAEFSLAGKITCVPRPTSIQYRFDLLMALQICYNVNGKQVLMNSPGVLEPYLFSKLMTEKEIRERISLTPNAPCLNLK